MPPSRCRLHNNKRGVIGETAGLSPECVMFPRCSSSGFFKVSVYCSMVAVRCDEGFLARYGALIDLDGPGFRDANTAGLSGVAYDDVRLFGAWGQISRPSENDYRVFCNFHSGG